MKADVETLKKGEKAAKQVAADGSAELKAALAKGAIDKDKLIVRRKSTGV